MTTKTAAKGRTEVASYKPVTYDESKDGPKLNEVQLVETFTGGVEGEGRARVLQAQWDDGSSRYCTIERVVGVGAASGWDGAGRPLAQGAPKFLGMGRPFPGLW